MAGDFLGKATFGLQRLGLERGWLGGPPVKAGFFVAAVHDITCGTSAKWPARPGKLRLQPNAASRYTSFLVAVGRKPRQGATWRLQAMTISPDPAHIRTIVFRTFLELDVPEESLEDLDERLLLDEGRYVARSYRVDELLAMWMIDVGLIQFYDSSGNMLRTVNVFEEIEPQRMAA
jgi:hypothetical protein